MRTRETKVKILKCEDNVNRVIEEIADCGKSDNVAFGKTQSVDRGI